jgi:hypothetical protein
VRVGLGEGVAPPEGVGSVEPDGTGDADGVAEGEGSADADGDAAAVDGGGPVDGLGLDDAPDVAVPGADDPASPAGPPDGVVVQPATTPAHASAPSATAIRLIPSG